MSSIQVCFENIGECCAVADETNQHRLDLKGDHFMLPYEDTKILRRYAKFQEAHPAPFHEHLGRRIYESRSDFGRMRKSVNFVKVTDFGLAVRGDVPVQHNHDIQPQEYTAPEVMLKAGWSYPADIWNLGLVVRYW